VRTLPRSTRRLYRPTHRPEDTPFLESLDDAARIMAELQEPFRSMYAMGLYSMLRTGEIQGLHAEDVNLERSVIRVHQQVQWGKLGPLKDDETRVVPIQAALAPLLKARMLAVGGTGPLFPTTQQRGGGRAGRRARFIGIHTLHARFREAVTAAGRADVIEWDKPFYQATRHTGASHWVMGGGNLATLARILGHSTTWVTEHYAHIIPGRFAPEDFERLSASVGSRLAPEPTPLPGADERKRQPKR
jgi:integrase